MYSCIIVCAALNVNLVVEKWNMHFRCVVLSTDMAVYSYLSLEYILSYYLHAAGLEVLLSQRPSGNL